MFKISKSCMNKFVFGILLVSTISCKGQGREEASTKSNIDSTAASLIKPIDFIKDLDELKLKSDASKSYELVKKSIETVRLNSQNKNLSIDAISKIFKQSLLHKILPFWNGTKWSFEGHTSIPKKGTIAFGYFVSTTLKHIGLHVNRYALAQQSPINEARSLALTSEIIEITENAVEENIARINKRLKDGIYFIGFEASHVGYILKEKKQLYLIYSNYIDNKGVEIEKIEKSTVFASYSKFYIVALSTNEKLLKNWIKGIKIQVIK